MKIVILSGFVFFSISCFANPELNDFARYEWKNDQGEFWYISEWVTEVKSDKVRGAQVKINPTVTPPAKSYGNSLRYTYEIQNIREAPYLDEACEGLLPLFSPGSHDRFALRETIQLMNMTIETCHVHFEYSAPEHLDLKADVWYADVPFWIVKSVENFTNRYGTRIHEELVMTEFVKF